jgi:aminopeptidase-like protein
MHVLQHSGRPCKVLDFYPYGYDERQYCAPAFNLPVGVLMRSVHGCFPQYHTSADDLAFVQPSNLGDSFIRCLEIVTVLENNCKYRNLNPKCEPQLGRRGLYRNTGGRPTGQADQHAVLWVLNFSDGAHTLLEIAERANLPFAAIRNAAEALQEIGLLEKIAPECEGQ